MISVIIPCYNAAGTIAATIESALSQGTLLEVIVVNDGSTDNSLAVIEGFGDRIRVHSGPNRGVSAARNSGVEMARGDYIQFIDSDDLLLPDALAGRLALLAGGAADVAHDDWQKLETIPGKGWTPTEIVRPPLEAMAKDIEATTAASTFWAPPVALLYSRDIVRRAGPMRANLPVIQDARFLHDVAAAGGRFSYRPAVGAYYRVASSSLSRGSRERFLADCAVNTAEIEADWAARGVLTPARLETLMVMWRQLAIAGLVEGLAVFDTARDGLNKVGARDWRLEAFSPLRRILGPKAAARLARAAVQPATILRRNG